MTDRSGARTPHPWRTEALWGALASVLSVLLAGWRVGAPGSLSATWGAFDLTTSYGAARTLLTHAWLSPNPDLAFPFGQDLAAFPATDLLNFAELKVLVLATGDPVVAVNAYLVLCFALIAATTYALMRVVRIPPMVAAALAVSFSLIPWHFSRFIHSSLANYSTVAVGLILVVAVLSWNLALSGPERARPRTLVITLGLTVYVGLTGTYYSVFISVLALVGLAFQVMLGRRGRVLVPAVWFAVLPTGISLAAARLYALGSSGAASERLARTPEESQHYGGALFTLLRTTGLWSESGPIPGLHLVSTVNSGLEADARNSTVGLVAVVIAFLASGLILAANGQERSGRLVASLGYWPWLFMVSLLFFVVGGFGQAFSLAFAYQIRSWGRFSIVVIAIAYVILGLTIAYAAAKSRDGRAVLIVASVIVVVVTVLDLVSMRPPIDAATGHRDAADLRTYGESLDAALPAGCGVFTLPAYRFPEGDPGDGTRTYDPLLPYLFAQNPRWSYGGVSGTPAGDWQFDSVSRHVPTMIGQLAGAGFCALQVDTRAFADGPSPAPSIEAALGAPVATSPDGRWLTYSLSTADAGAFAGDDVFEPVAIAFGFGFDPPTALQSSVSATLRGTDGTIVLANPRDSQAAGTLELDVIARQCPAGSHATLTTADSAVDVVLDGEAAAGVSVEVPAHDIAVAHVQIPAACSIEVVNPRFIPS